MTTQPYGNYFSCHFLQNISLCFTNLEGHPEDVAVSLRQASFSGESGVEGSCTELGQVLSSGSYGGVTFRTACTLVHAVLYL